MFRIGDKVDYVGQGKPEPFGTITRIGEEESFFLGNCYKVRIEHPTKNENPVGQESFFWYGQEQLAISEITPT